MSYSFSNYPGSTTYSGNIREDPDGTTHIICVDLRPTGVNDLSNLYEFLETKKKKDIAGATASVKGKDIAGVANTGTGKTASFLIPLIDKALKNKSE